MASERVQRRIDRLLDQICFIGGSNTNRPLNANPVNLCGSIMKQRGSLGC